MAEKNTFYSQTCEIISLCQRLQTVMFITKREPVLTEDEHNQLNEVIKLLRDKKENIIKENGDD